MSIIVSTPSVATSCMPNCN
ncbi:hypothetical protein [Sodaliphilus sp.]